MEGSEWLDAVKLIGGLLAVVIIGVGGWFQGKRGPKQSHSTEGDVVAATFAERSLMEKLTAALLECRLAIIVSTEQTKRVADLLEEDAHRREVAAEVRQALKDRGIVE